MNALNLLPVPRSVRLRAGSFVFPARTRLELDASLSKETAEAIAWCLQSAADEMGVRLQPARTAGRGVGKEPRMGVKRNSALKEQQYALTVDGRGVEIEFHDDEGLHAAVATLRQLMRGHGRRLPCVEIRDHPDFSKRGVMLDISRGRVPRVETLMELAGHLADFKINEFQLYIEHTFAYRKYGPVWRDWGAVTGEDMAKLDAHCRRLGIELVPNQNSFGHLRYLLEYSPLKKLAETREPWLDGGGAFLRRPSTLAPNHPGTLPFLRGLYNELLPNFSSRRVNVGCDETWDLGRAQSKKICAKKGKGRVYLEFLKKIHREMAKRGRRMMFWGDIILHHPELVKELPADVIALNWGYEAAHPFEQEAGIFEASGIPFYVCPGTSTWMTLIGRHDNAFANLRGAAKAGRTHGAIGYLNTDWGDGGHPQPLAVSYLPYLLGAAASWHSTPRDEALLVPVINRDVFRDATGRVGEAALALGLAHRKFKYFAPNATPFGATIAAPPPEQQELFCRDGLKYYARIPGRNIRAALEEVEAQRDVLRRARPVARAGEVLAGEIDLAARMAAQSCQYMLWQQALAGGRDREVQSLAKRAVRELRELDAEFTAYWPTRNKGTPRKCAAFLGWRMEDYRRGALHFPPEVARRLTLA